MEPPDGLFVQLVLPKMEELDMLALSTNAAIIAVTETWLDSLICDNEVCIPAMAYSATIETVREKEFVFLSVTILILIGGVTLIKMILNFWV